MSTNIIPRGTVLFHAGDTLDTLSVITAGSVKTSFDGGELLFGKGDILGLYDIGYGVHSLTYTTFENTVLAPYKIPDPLHFMEFLEQHPDIRPLVFIATMQIIKQVFDQYIFLEYDCKNLYDYLLKSYDTYKNFCEKYNISPKALPGMEDISPLLLEKTMDAWIPAYYDSLETKGISGGSSLMDSPCLLSGFVLRASRDMHEIGAITCEMLDYKADLSRLLLNENRLDLFDLYTDLYYRFHRLEPDDITSLGANIGRLMLQAGSCGSIDPELSAMRANEYREKARELTARSQNTPEMEADGRKLNPELKDSLYTILEYSGCDEPVCRSFLELIRRFRELPDRNAADESSIALRKSITKLFHTLYLAVFQRSLAQDRLPAAVRLFLDFGYVDEELAGSEAASYLCSLTDKLDREDGHVYTLYQWLKAIYDGRKEPSRNELDTDYDAHLRDLRISNKISPEEEKRLQNDNMNKVIFELENMFPIVNKLTFGRITIYCPVFSEHNILKSLASSYLNAEKINRSIDRIRSTDFSAYCREVIYSSPDLGIPKEYIDLEVLPDIILMPNIGTRGIMWQEIEGKRRNTPSRMMVSIFHLEDFDTTLTRLTGEFRWEMCKRIQGARWNDVSERSLTSEYTDYIQFYRKNMDLSPEAKNKIKLGMTKAKNSFKEMFVQDYLIWMQSEGNGSPRLNRVARSILFTYCPFTREIRDKLAANPLYREIIDRYNIKNSARLHRLDNIMKKLRSTGNSTPGELETQQAFLEK